MKNVSILAVDDDSLMLLMAEEAFSDESVLFTGATSGEEALERLPELKPDLILLDIMMPGLDGYEVCSRIRDMPEFFHTPVIMLTGLEEPAAVERAYECGAWDFVSKPVNWPILKHRVRHAVRAASAFASERRSATLSRTLDNSPSEVITFDAESGTLLSANASALRNLGLTETDLHSIKFTDIARDLTSEIAAGKLRERESRKQAKLDFSLARKDGTTYPVEGILLYTEDVKPYVYTAILNDTTEKKRVQEELHRLAFYDELTGLPNRRHLQEHVAHALSIAERKVNRCAICILDLDGFKLVNDTLGHSVGDLLLKEVAQRLRSALRECDLLAREAPAELTGPGGELARLGGDEFMIVLSNLDDAGVPATVAARVLEQVALPCHINGIELKLTASLGISLYPEDGDSLDILMMHADTAMYRAKSGGKNNYAFYKEEAGCSSLARLRQVSQLRSALQNDELELHFQPILDSSLYRIVGAECLVRWRHPEDGLRDPDTFIPIAEETGLIQPIGEWALSQAVMQLQRWSSMLHDDFSMSVNVSSLQTRNNRFLEFARELFAANTVARGKVVIELTESALMNDAGVRIKWLRELKDLGVRIAVDNFGTGYSSLSYLKKLPIDYIKVDGSFVVDLDVNRNDKAIVKAIFRMAQALEIALTVDGVENTRQLQVLQEFGDFRIQGSLVSEPLPAKAFEAFYFGYASDMSYEGKTTDCASNE